MQARHKLIHQKRVQPIYLMKAFSVCLTQESGSSETRLMNRKTRLPRARPKQNHTMSAARALARQHAIAGRACRFPVRTSAPTATSNGAEGNGSAPCSASTQKNRSA